MTTKDKANKRLQDQWSEAQKEKEKTGEEYKREKVLINKTIQTQGWSIIVKSLHDTIRSLTDNLQKTSPFRVLKGLELRSEIKSLQTLLRSMLKNEKINLADKLKG